MIFTTLGSQVWYDQSYDSLCQFQKTTFLSRHILFSINKSKFLMHTLKGSN